MKWVSRGIFFFSGSRQEVNSTWYPEIEEPIKSREKHYSLVLYILNENNIKRWRVHHFFGFCFPFEFSYKRNI